MHIFSDPRIAPPWTIAFATVFLGVGVTMSMTRLKTVAYERANHDIAQSRVALCRVLGNSETVKLGGYYFQPTPQTNGLIGGDLLTEGIYICDLFGNSARIERGGYAQFVVSGDPLEMNKILLSRLQDPVNPDNSASNRPRLDMTRPIYKAQPQQTTDKLFP